MRLWLRRPSWCIAWKVPMDTSIPVTSRLSYLCSSSSCLCRRGRRRSRGNWGVYCSRKKGIFLFWQNIFPIWWYVNFLISANIAKKDRIHIMRKKSSQMAVRLRNFFDRNNCTGTPPLTRFFGPRKNRVKGKPRYRRSILVLKPKNGEYKSSKSTFSPISNLFT